MILSEVREYKVQERIGRGSFGEVFLVVHKQSRKQYVLKRVRLARQNEWQRAASHLEMFLAKQLWHPFIVPHVESWVDRGHTIHLVHEYCINGDLHSLLQRLKGKSIPEDQLKLWLAQALLAMDYLHGHGIVHRDLKLSNLFLNDDGDVLLGDFGLAAFRRGAANEDNSLVGTPQYMSPELLSSDRYGLPTDIWSLGCCLWELTSGRPAFQAFNFDGLVQKITKGQAGTLPMQYSEGWAALLRTMLIKNPDRRASISSILEAPCMRHAVRDATARCRLLAKSMGIEELPPICRTPRLDELEEDGQATTAEILRRAHIPLGIHPENSEDNRTLTARSAPDESQSSMHDMEEIPFQDSRQDALHPGAMTPSAQKIAAAAAQSETPASRRLNYNTKFGGSEMMETSVMEGMDGALYLSPSMDGSGMGMPASASNSHRTHEPHMVLEIEDAAASSEEPNSSLGRAGQGPTSAAMQPVMAPTHADEHPRQMYSNQNPLSGQDLPSPGDNLLEQRPSDTGMPDEASLRQRQPKPQPMLSTEAHFGPASGASSPPESAAGLGDDQGLDGFRRRSTLPHQSNASTNKKLHTAPAASEQDSFAGKATEQWQSTRPGRGRDTAAARRAQMAGDQGAKTNASGGVRKMLRSASDACKRLAEGVATNTRESRRQRSKSQAPSATESRAPTRGRLTGQATSGVKGTTSTAGAGRLGARGAATTGVTGSKVPGSVEIRMQQRAMRQFDKNNTRTGRTGRAATARDSETADKETNSVYGRGSVSARGSTVSRRTSSVQPRPVSRTTTTRTGRDQTTRDKSRTRSRTVTPRTNNSPTRAAALQTAPAAPVEPPSWQMSPAVERALQTLPSTSDALNAANSGPASAATDTGDISRMMNSLASEPGTASNNVQKELSLMHSTMPATLASDAVPTTWANDASVPDLGKDMQIHPPAPMHAHSRTDSMGDRLPGEVLESAASGNPQTPGLNDTNAAMDYAGFDGGHSLYTIADASGLMTPASGMATPGGMSTPGGMTPPSRDRAHERKFSTAPSSEESWVEMSAGAAGSSRNGSGWQVQGQPWASNKSSRNGSIDDTPITPAEPSIGEGSLSPLGPHGMLPAGGPQGKAVFQPSPTKPTGARGPLDSDEHLRIHNEHHKRLQASSSAKDVLDSGRTASGESSFANSGGTSPRKSKGAGGSLEEALGTAVEEAYKLLQEKKYAQAEAVLDGARKRYQRNRSMLERFDNNAKARVSGSGTGVSTNNAGRVAGTASAAPTTRRTPVRRSGSVGPSAMQTRVEARSKRGASSARGESSTRERGLKSPATKASPGRSTGSGTLARGRTRQPAAAASMAAGNKGPVTTMQMNRKNSGKKSSSGDIQSHPVGGYPSIMPASAPVVVQQPLNSAVSLTGPANSGPRSFGGSDGGGDIELDMGGVSAGVGAGQVVSMANAAMNGPKSLPTEVLSMSDTLAGAASPERGPVSAADESAARVGDVVRVGKVRAVVRYVGPVKGLSRGPWVGLELSHPCGTGTGTINGIEYFSCAPQCGAFVALDKLMPDNDAYSTDI